MKQVQRVKEKLPPNISISLPDLQQADLYSRCLFTLLLQENLKRYWLNESTIVAKNISRMYIL